MPSSNDSDKVPTSERIIGFDVARSLAILGMILVHFGLVLSKDRTSPPALATVLDILDGRAAMLFVLLAGIGITLIFRRRVESNNSSEIGLLCKTLIRRGMFLFVLGILNLVIWPGDILRVYGVTFLLAACLIQASFRTLLAVAAAFSIAFAAMLHRFVTRTDGCCSRASMSGDRLGTCPPRFGCVPRTRPSHCRRAW